LKLIAIDRQLDQRLFGVPGDPLPVAVHRENLGFPNSQSREYSPSIQEPGIGGRNGPSASFDDAIVVVYKPVHLPVRRGLF
jgi:hypothetical protein